MEADIGESFRLWCWSKATRTLKICVALACAWMLSKTLNPEGLPHGPYLGMLVGVLFPVVFTLTFVPLYRKNRGYSLVAVAALVYVITEFIRSPYHDHIVRRNTVRVPLVAYCIMVAGVLVSTQTYAHVLLAFWHLWFVYWAVELEGS